MEPIIKVENLGKSYIIGHQREKYVALRDVLTNKARQVASKTKNLFSGGQLIAGNEMEEFWALKDINFEVQQGDRVGIIGRNGAGKSTLLKVLSRITEPTTGRIHMQGRVASLLEVGTGFHPELSGRENIYLNGAILGMSRVEVRKKFDEIVDFAGVEKFLDTPVKRYSSGMYVRLAFAVAAHLEPEILIVDEVLAVGDSEFQKKCLGKMEDVSKNHGRTVLFVSHDMANISSLTNNAICLANGEMAYQGNTRDAINYYLQNGLNISSVFKAELDTNKPNFTYAAVKTSETDSVHFNGKDLEIEFEIFMPQIIEGMAISFQIFNSRRISVIYGYLFDVDQPILRGKGLHKYKCKIPNCKLYQDTYYLKLHLAESKGKEKFQEIDNICDFEVKMMGKIIEWGWQKDVCIYTTDIEWIYE